MLRFSTRKEFGQRCFPASNVVAARRRYPGSIILTSPALELGKILNVEIACRKFLCNTDSTVFIESAESLGLYSVQPLLLFISAQVISSLLSSLLQSLNTEPFSIQTSGIKEQSKRYWKERIQIHNSSSNRPNCF